MRVQRDQTFGGREAGERVQMTEVFIEPLPGNHWLAGPRHRPVSPAEDEQRQHQQVGPRSRRRRPFAQHLLKQNHGLVRRTGRVYKITDALGGWQDRQVPDDVQKRRELIPAGLAASPPGLRGQQSSAEEVRRDRL